MDILAELLSLSHHLGEETRDYVIIGEGNTSARIDADFFWIKASGQNLGSISADGFVKIQLRTVLTLLEGDATDEDVTRVLIEAQAAGDGPRPSVETILHAVLYHLTEAQFIGHTHPVAVNSILCSRQARQITGHLMPDEIVVCGANSVFVPYTDPGLQLARQMYRLVSEFIGQNSEAPRVMYLENHGLFVVGSSVRQVENVTAMAVKHARVLAGTQGFGGPRWLEADAVARIHTRPDEAIRRKQFE